MASRKIAVSLPEHVYEQAECWAKRLNMSRSQFYAMALEDELTRQENARMVKQIDAAYPDGLSQDELAFMRAAARHLGEITRGEW